MLDTLKEHIRAFFKSRLVPITAIYIILFAILTNRMFQLQILEGDTYASEAVKRTTKTRAIKASRGN
ncbi:MAG TPA: hypothetical protein DCZ23_04110, partial [Lachnospiraceae bacterium]|nr:hypothetical protein [Lachnospiraceae bacterium]